MDGVLIGLAIVLALGGVFLITSALRKGSTKMNKPIKIKSFYTEGYLDKAIKTIITVAEAHGYKVDDVNENNGIVVLRESTSFIGFGNIFPIYLILQPDQSLLIELGIENKSTEIALLDPPHERCFTIIKAAFQTE
jgi:hypothetical protein